MLCPVILHQFLHVLVKLVAVLRVVHIYEINDHYSAKVPEPHLTGNLVSRMHVHLENVIFLFDSFLYPGAAVDIHYVQSLRMFYDKISAFFKRHHLTERAFYLSCDIELVKNRQGPFVQFDYLFLFRGDGPDVISYLIIS